MNDHGLLGRGFSRDAWPAQEAVESRGEGRAEREVLPASPRADQTRCAQQLDFARVASLDLIMHFGLTRRACKQARGVAGLRWRHTHFARTHFADAADERCARVRRYDGKTQRARCRTALGGCSGPAAVPCRGAHRARNSRGRASRAADRLASSATHGDKECHLRLGDFYRFFQRAELSFMRVPFRVLVRNYSLLLKTINIFQHPPTFSQHGKIFVMQYSLLVGS